MKTPQKLSFSTFLTLMLIQAALSVPVEPNNKVEGAEPKSNDELFLETHKNLTELLKNLVEQESNEVKVQIDNFLTGINSIEANKKLNALLAELSKQKLAETSRNLTERVSTTAKKEFYEVKSMFDSLLSSINLTEPGNKIKNLLVQMSDKNFFETYRNLTAELTKLVEQESTALKAKIDALLAQTNLVENNKILKDSFTELTDQKLAETCKNLTERLTNLIKQELANVKATSDNLLAHINSVGASKNLMDLLAQFSSKKIAETYNHLKERLKSLVKQEFSYVKAKAYEELTHKNLNATNKKIKDLMAELSDQKLAETYNERLNERLGNLVKQQLTDVKAKVYDVLTLASSENRR